MVQHDSSQNHQCSSMISLKPEAGMGATEIYWTHRSAYTITEVINDKKIVVQRDKAKRTDENGMSDIQIYEFSPDPNGSKLTLTLRNNGCWVPVGERTSDRHFIIGMRQEFYDYNF